MLNRRHLRIKVLQILYAFYQSEERDPLQAKKELDNSIGKIYELYLYFLQTFGELVTIANQRMDAAPKKFRPTEEDLNPSRNFIDNIVFNALLDNKDLQKKAKESHINWESVEKRNLMTKLFKKIRSSAIYQEYMEVEQCDFEKQRDFAVEIFKVEIANFELLHDFFEEESIYWMDDIDLVCSMVLKTIKQIDKDKKGLKVLPLYKDEKDEKEFIHQLLLKTIETDESNDELIDELAKNWELDRIARMDIILLKMALTELSHLTSIPKKVTLNEYIEISKFYSTPKSQIFINGILDKAVAKLEKEGKLVKKGRGLID